MDRNYKAGLEKQKYFQLQDRNDKAKTLELEHKYNSLLLKPATRENIIILPMHKISAKI